MFQKKMMKPYVKQYDANGKVVNEITPKNPYQHPMGASFRAERRGRVRLRITGLDLTSTVLYKVKSGKINRFTKAGKRVQKIGSVYKPA